MRPKETLIGIEPNYLPRIHSMNKTINIKNVGYSIMFLFLLFLNAIGNTEKDGLVGLAVKHYDEVLTLLLLFYIFLHSKLISKCKKKIIMLQFGFNAIGFISSIAFHYQGIIGTLVDAVILVNRFLIAYYSAVIYMRLHKKNMSCRILWTAKFVTIVLFILSLHDIFMTPLFPKSDYRYFMYGLQLMFSHATYMAAASATLLIYFGYMNSKKTKYIPYMIIATLLVCFTLRTKAIGFVMMYWLFYYRTFILKSKRYYLTGAISIVAVLFIAHDSFMDHFLTSTRYMPRMIMLKDSIKLMLSHFPLGTGFGSYGSAIAASSYSPLYSQLGYMSNYGMSQDNTSFLTDAFWPTIIAQFGFIGTVLFIVLIVMLVKYALKTLKINKSSGFSMLMIIAYYCITSIAESAFFIPTALLMFLMFGIYEIEGQRGATQLFNASI